MYRPETKDIVQAQHGEEIRKSPRKTCICGLSWKEFSFVHFTNIYI